MGLKAGGFNAKDLKEDGFNAKYLKELGFNGKDLKELGFSARSLGEAGFFAKSLQAKGTDNPFQVGKVILADKGDSFSPFFLTITNVDGPKVHGTEGFIFYVFEAT